MLENIKLIAARAKIHVPFDQYLDLLRKEFTVGTHYKNESSNSMEINFKSEIPMSLEVIENGIELSQHLGPIE